jgi:hypothetical protein
MGITRRDPKGDTFKRRPAAAVPLKEPEQPGNQVDASQDDHDKGSRVYYHLSSFTTYDAGYLKLRRESDGPQLHLTWTWTLTRHAGTYVYVRINFWEIDTGLNLLWRKVLEVESGVRKPTADKFKDSHI